MSLIFMYVQIPLTFLGDEAAGRWDFPRYSVRDGG